MYVSVHQSLTPGFVTCQASLSVEFFRQEYRSGLPFPLPEDLPDPGIELVSPVSPALWVDSLPAELSGKPIYHSHTHIYLKGYLLFKKRERMDIGLATGTPL